MGLRFHGGRSYTLLWECNLGHRSKDGRSEVAQARGWRPAMSIGGGVMGGLVGAPALVAGWGRENGGKGMEGHDELTWGVALTGEGPKASP